MSRAEANALKNLNMNSEPQSEVTWDGTLCLEKTFFTKTSASPVASMVLMVSMKIACLVSLSTTTRMSVKPWDSGSCLMKSIEMDSQEHGGIGNCLSKPYGWCLFGLLCIQILQVLT